MKKCSQCKTIKLLSEFNKRTDRNGIAKPECKVCQSKMQKQYRHSKEGLVTKIYHSQIRNSVRRGHPNPNYTKEELRIWAFSQPNFQELFDNWVKSNFDKMLIPSPDRLDDNIPYALDNLRLVTWGVNKKKSHEDQINGIDVRKCKITLQYDLNGTLIKEYYSTMQAQRETGVGHISSVCLGSRKTAGGFKWQHA